MLKSKKQAELRAKLKKIESELKELQKKYKDIKKRAEDFMENVHENDVSSKIKSIRGSL